MNTGIVYLIENTVNNKKYIGITTLKLEKRWSLHKNHSKKSSYPLYRAIRKYGIDKFTISKIKEITHDSRRFLIKQLEKLEKKYIKKYHSFVGWNDAGYNLTTGGDISNISRESRKKQGKTLQQLYVNNPVLRNRNSLAIKESWKNTELREKMSRIQKERFKNPEERRKISVSIKNAYKVNPALREKMRKINKTVNSDPKKRKQQSEKMTGSNHPRFDYTIYTFNNANTGEIFSGTRYDFYKKYNLPQHKICRLVSGKKKSYKHWFAVREDFD